MNKFAVCGLLGLAFAGLAAQANLVDDWMRYFEARNAVANQMLSPPDESQPPVNLEHPDEMSRITCPACGGKGEILQQEPDYGQWDGRLNKGSRKERVRCPLCGGRKWWQAYIEPRELYMIVAQARNAFMVAHQSRGDVAVGQAFVPRQIYDSVNRKLLKLVEETYGKPCSRCGWTGIEECKKCKGAGTMKCPEKDCKAGWIVTKTVTTYSSSPSRSHGSMRRHNRSSSKRESVTVTKCRVCQGMAIVICEECKGCRAQTCSKCRGLGIKQKN